MRKASPQSLYAEYKKAVTTHNRLVGRIERLQNRHGIQIEGVTVGTFIHPGKDPQPIVARTHEEIDVHLAPFAESAQWAWGKSTAILARHNLKRNVLCALLQRQLDEYDRLMEETGVNDLAMKALEASDKGFEALEQFIACVPKTLAECRTKARLAVELERTGELGTGDAERIVASFAGMAVVHARS